MWKMNLYPFEQKMTFDLCMFYFEFHDIDLFNFLFSFCLQQLSIYHRI